MTIREALLAMAYIEAFPKKWAKPVGFHLLTYNEENGFVENWFKGPGDQKIDLWEKRNLPQDENFLLHLKNFECFTRHDIYNPNSQFHLNRRYDM